MIKRETDSRATQAVGDGCLHMIPAGMRGYVVRLQDRCAGLAIAAKPDITAHKEEDVCAVHDTDLASSRFGVLH